LILPNQALKSAKKTGLINQLTDIITFCI